MQLSDELRALADRLDAEAHPEDYEAVQYFFVGAVLAEGPGADFAFHQGGELATRYDTLADLAKKGALDHFGKMRFIQDRYNLEIRHAA